MTDKAHRKALTEQYKQARAAAGVYRIVNTRTGKALLGSTTNLVNIQNKLDFAASTRTYGVLDRRLRADLEQFGAEVFELEIVETLAVTPEMTSAKVRQELETLEALHRERFDPATLY
jgi:hypothetical protein